MKSMTKSLWLALLVVFALFAAACGDDDDSTSETSASADDAADDAAAEEEDHGDEDHDDDDHDHDDEEAAASLPGEGVSVTMSRANWSTGYMQAAIYKALLEEMGYEVNEPADLELPPSNFFTALGLSLIHI